MSELPIESKKYGKFVVLYDECDFELVNKHKWGIKKDKGTFYARTHITDGNGKRTTLMMHRLLTKAPPGVSVDHINHCGWDNRRFNLRFCTNQENSQNRLKRSNTSSKFKGVCWDKDANKWRVYIQIDGKSKKHLGLYTDEVIAAHAYDEAALIHFGPYAQLNFSRPIVVNNISNITNIYN